MNILYITYPLNGLLMISMSILLGIYLARKFNLGWRLWWIGAGTFVLSQIGHIPFNLGLTSLFESGLLPGPPVGWELPFNALVLGLSAGLWEEFARYAMYRWWAKDARSWSKGLMLGTGHGGAEAIILGILVLLNFIALAALREVDLSSILPLDQVAVAQERIQAYWSTPWYSTLLGALERALTIPVQISFSIIILQVFTRGQFRWLWLAVVWHAVIDAVAVFGANTWGIYITEAILGVATLGSLGFIFGLRQDAEDSDGELKSPPPPKELIDLPEVEDTPESVNESRYN